jgi:hypothetical protein
MGDDDDDHVHDDDLVRLLQPSEEVIEALRPGTSKWARPMVAGAPPPPPPKRPSGRPPNRGGRGDNHHGHRGKLEYLIMMGGPGCCLKRSLHRASRTGRCRVMLALELSQAIILSNRLDHIVVAAGGSAQGGIQLRGSGPRRFVVRPPRGEGKPVA